MANPPPTPPENLRAVLQAYSTTATGVYTATAGDAQAVPADGLKDEELKQAQARIQQAQARNAGAFSQLVTAASLVSEQDGRDGYLAVVQLMKTAADTADKVCTKLLEVLHADGSAGVPQSADVAVINAFVGVLNALAELSPDSAWATPQASANQ